MLELTREASGNSFTRIGAQPIALATAILLLILTAGAGIALWRAYSGISPELDRAVIARKLQARATQASEQLVEKTKGLEVTQQESIDQLQMMQDQLQEMRKQIAAQQADTKRLSEQMSSLSEAVDGLRQSFASAQSTDTSSAPPSRHRALHARAHAASRSKS
jgi:flagellar motility protein MotE (MotC chaperone)